MNFETVNIIGTSLAAVKMFFFFFFTNEDLLKTAKTTKEVDDIMKDFQFSQNNNEIREVLIWTKNDDFKKETLRNVKNDKYIGKLNKLKSEFLDFYLKFLSELTNKESEYQRSCDVYTKIGKYIQQIMRLRMVIQPELQIAMNIHTKSRIEYLAAKAFWLNDNGVKERKFTRSLGRVDDYAKGKDDPKVRKEAISKIQEAIYEAYLETYPE